MGRKKSARKPTKYLKPKLEATFSCLFCNHEKSVICTLDKKALIGSLKCKFCGQTFQTTISVLSAPVDVYSDWVDVCEDLNETKDDASKYGTGQNEDDEDREFNPSASNAAEDEYDSE